MSMRYAAELLFWASLLVFMLISAQSRMTISQEAIDALIRDGYRDVRLKSGTCRVAEATDFSGREVTAYACGW